MFVYENYIIIDYKKASGANRQKLFLMNIRDILSSFRLS